MHRNRTYLFWIIAVLFAVAVIFAVLYYRGAFLNYFSRSAGITPGSGASLSTANLPNINASSTIQDVQDLALKFNTQGSKLFLTWTKLSDDMYEVRIFRAKKGAAWELWKTVVVHGAPGNQTEISITPDEAKSLLDYTYFFEARTSNGTTVGTSNVIAFNSSNPDASGNITTIDTHAQVPPAVVVALPGVTDPGQTASPPAEAPPAVTPPVVTPPAAPPATPPATSTNPNSSGTPPVSPAPPANTPTPVGVTPYIVYYYTPDGRISSTSTFPAPSQNFWVDHQSGKVELGWQNLPTSTVEIDISRAPSQDSLWEVFFTQERPILDRPYSIFLNDIGTISPFYYKLEAFDSNHSLLSSYGPLYLNPASP